MKWYELMITVNEESAEPVCAILYDRNVGGLSIEDDTLALEASRSTSKWDVLDEGIIKDYNGKTVIKAYFPSKDGAEDAVKAISEDESFPEVVYDLKEIDEEDWANNWKQYYKPVEIGESIAVFPSWEEFKTDRKVRIRLDPGMAFGAGTHETTVMCLELLEKYMKENYELLDIGTGSGILAIAAAKLGAKSVTAVDIDEVAVKVAKENIEFNGETGKITVKAGSFTENITDKFNIVVANIIADAIAFLSRDVRRFIKEGGLFIASGIIDTKLDMVLKALNNNKIKVEHIEKRGDWAALVCSCR